MKTSSLITMLTLWGASCALAAPSAPVEQTPAFIPQPVSSSIETGKAGFSLAHGLKVDYKTSRSPIGRVAVRALQSAGIEVLPEENAGELTLRQARGVDPEWYAIEVTPQGVAISFNDPQALYLAAQTLAQAVSQDKDGKPALPSMRIEDKPLLRYRGLMVDVARFHRSVDEMKQVIRLMARYKLNRLHLHLTDDQGWRIEIKKYPKLTEIGSKRESSLDPVTRQGQDGKPSTGFYTQNEIRDLVAYAKVHGITVIPEIEVPGHNSALLAAYPELGNDDIPNYNPKVSVNWGVHEYIMSPKPATFRFLQDVFDEVCELFPDAPYIHIGGDEVPRNQWNASAGAKRFMAEHGMKKSAEIQHYFTHFCLDELKERGRRIIGWDEIQQDGGINPSAIVMVWRDVRYAYSALRAGHEVILSPTSHFYLDYGQGKFPKDRSYRGIGTSTGCDWQRLYSYDPLLPNLTPEQQGRILGVQGNLWGEYTHNFLKFQYMLVPRICALAEVAWTPKAKRDEAEFAKRLLAQYPYFDSEGINFREEDGTPRVDREAMTRDNAPKQQ